MKPYKILIVDDHSVVREGIKLILETTNKFEVIGEAVNGVEALRLVTELLPDAVLMDLRMPVMDGIEVMKVLKDKGSSIPIIILTTYDEGDLMLEALNLGAKGYLLKDTTSVDLFRVIESAIVGDTILLSDMMTKLISITKEKLSPVAEEENVLTIKELEILRLVARGYKSKEIAFDFGISERTVKAHLTSIYSKLEVDSRSKAVAVALEKKMIHLN
ncbi:response regulator transcription factor [Paenibacillus sp. FSL R7-0048]|uniref:response regulator n=1 Tax=Paenibacillus TaxID=44249 RepID=UPI00096DDED3|nr:response regulator transcription factor [Paenibacillus odorifer]OMD70159.1 DNA-binding response regulator [Paenibacillus odorifer]OMD83623.1 DNA-binding response regulator [Paenibacillus odorifer]